MQQKTAIDYEDPQHRSKTRMSGVDPRRLADNYRPLFGIPWTPRLTREQLEKVSEGPGGVQRLLEYQKARAEAEKWAEKNPTGSGWVLPSWKRVMDAWKDWPVQIVLGGVRSSKSSLASRLVVWAMGTIPEAQIRCYHVNSERSAQDQQRFVYDALPSGLRSLPTKRSASHTVQFTQANGFTGDKLILPPLPEWQRGGECIFSNYKSWSNDPKTAEGFKAHLVWGDEAMPMELLKTLTFRTTDYHGRILLTFTTLEGWSPLVQLLLGKVRTLETIWSPHVKRKVEILQESLSFPGTLIHYFQTDENPFIDREEFRRKLKGRPVDEILAYAHGIPTKAATAVFTQFNREYAPIGNVVKHADLPFVKNPQYPVTRYMAVDPAGSKNFFCVWVAIDAAGSWFVYREWPDAKTYGEWGESGTTIEGKAGPAQRSLGFGIRDYVELFKQLEKSEEIFERIIDPRMGAAEKQSSEEGATTIISDFEKHDVTFVPAPGVDIDNGLQLLQGLLAWNPQKERDALNSPKLFISDECQNIIDAFVSYTAKAGPNEVWKDSIDPLRYLAVSNIIYVAPEDATAQGSIGSY